MNASEEVTQLLASARAGDESASIRVFELVYKDLRALAARSLRAEKANHTLQPTALVHEVYLRIWGDGPPSFKDRVHFFSIVSRAMRRLLIDYARAKRAEKRGRDFEVVQLETEAIVSDVDCVQLLIVDDALTALEDVDERQCRIVEMRYFGGLTEDEIAELLNLSVRTVKRDWKHARAWLHDRLTRSVSTTSTE